MNWNDFAEMGLDVLLDTLKVLPILYLVYLLLEWLQTRFSLSVLTAGSHRHAMPFFAALCGLLPQCGFSAAAVALYNEGALGAGSLLAVFLSTSDEAFPILMANPDWYLDLLGLIACKLVFGVLLGYLFTYTVFRKRPFGDSPLTEHHEEEHEHHHDHDGHAHVHNLACEAAAARHSGEICRKEEDLPDEEDYACGCGCCKSRSIFLSALTHALKIGAYLLASLLIVQSLVLLVGDEALNRFLLSGGIFQPVLVALFGLIPGCGTSVLITELFLSGHLSFGSCLAGLCTGAGFGIPILLGAKKHRREGLLILLCLTLSAMLLGILTDAIIALF